MVIGEGNSAQLGKDVWMLGDADQKGPANKKYGDGWANRART